MTTDTEARAYELMLVLNADQSDDTIQKHIDSIKKLITDQGGEIFFEDVWGRRDLAYKIKKEEIGYYIVMNFTINGEKLKEIDDHMRIDLKLLRYLLIKTPEGYEPTPITEADLEWTKRIRKDDEEKEEESVVEEKPKKEEPKPEPEPEEKPEPEEEEVVEEEKPEEKPEEEAVEEEAEKEVVEEVEPEEKPEEEEIVEEEKPEEEAVEEEVTEEPEPEAEPEEKEPEKEDEKKTMDDLDEKLKAIMNDTDIDISL